MSEPGPSYIASLPDISNWLPLLTKLSQAMTEKQLIDFSVAMAELVDDPGYGEATITVFDHRVTAIKVTETHKYN